MAKRLTDTDKWKKPFVRGLDAPYKLLWFYILDDCDHAGVWQVDEDVAKIRVDQSIDFIIAKDLFKEQIQIIDNGNKWFIYDFVEFQYGTLNPENRVHKSVLDILNKYKIKPLRSPLQGAKDKDKDKDMDKDKEQEPKSEFDLVFDSYLEMRKKIKKPATEEAIRLVKEKLTKMCGSNELLKIRILNQSIINSWQDVYDIKIPKPQNKIDTPEIKNIKEY